MNTDLARAQFATTSVYHFLFVPITIGLAFLVAILETMWHRSGNDEYRRLTRFFGNLLVINVVVGVVTGLVQEFQFGMNWSAYSRFVGDVFGGPLAMEGLAAFFLESTFLGLWLFGWGRLSKRVHLTCIWLVAVGSMLSALFIIAANSWMQHPVGYTINKSTGRPVLNDIGALFTNPIFLWGYVHVILASLVMGALIMLAVSAWHLRREQDTTAFQRTAAASIVVLVPAIALTMFVGGRLGINETKYQPMKIAAAEAQWNTCQPCSFSAAQIGGYSSTNQSTTKIIEIPHLLSLLATNSWNGQVVGLNELQKQYVAKYGPGNYIPDVFIQYWSMRTMAYLATLVLLFALYAAWLLHKKKLHRSRRFLRVATWAFIAAFLMNTAGWLLTESGRQPWIVQGLMKTTSGVSPSVSSGTIWASLTVFVLLYLALGVADAVLMTRFARKRLPSESTPADEDAEEPALVY